MIKKTYLLTLASPAFLGDAEQKGMWRTPPLKALIREWWRVAVAKELGYDYKAIKSREALLFGSASDDGNVESQQSKIRLSLEHWRDGTMLDYKPLPTVHHKEVERTKHQVEPLNYLGYGPIDRGRLKNGAALQSGEQNNLRIAYPEEYESKLDIALRLIQWFGSIGGRSRNGWGSMTFQSAGESASGALNANALQEARCTRPLAQCLNLDWPHAIGTDDKGVLVWQCRQTLASWQEAMRFLAETKIGFRTSVGFSSGKNAVRVESRHILAYPVTNHSVSAWGNNARIANTLRFKLQLEPDQSVRALIYHTPCKPILPHDGVDLLDTWQCIHRLLDNHPELTRLA